MDNKNDRDIRVENAKNELASEIIKISKKYNLMNWENFEVIVEMATSMIAFNLKTGIKSKGQELRDKLLSEILSAMKADIIEKLKD